MGKWLRLANLASSVLVLMSNVTLAVDASVQGLLAYSVSIAQMIPK